MARGQWTEVDARGVLNALAKGGLSVVRFSEERGITPQRVYWWKQKLGQPNATSMSLLFVRVLNSPPPAPRRGEPVTVLLRSSHMVKVGRDFDEEVFKRVVALLEVG